MPLNTTARSACGVGLVANTQGVAKHEYLEQALRGLSCVEHRGGCASDKKTGDGAGIMAEIPWELLGYEPGSVAVGVLFMSGTAEHRRGALETMRQLFSERGLDITGERPVPIDTSVLGRVARSTLPTITQVFIKRPEFCRTEASFQTRLYASQQELRTRLNQQGYREEVFFTSLSTRTVVYKGLTTAEDLPAFYPDLQDPAFVSRFALFHRRFSTNTTSAWSRAQPFRMIGHNGEINTIRCNRAWGSSREQALGLPREELLTAEGISDSGSLNEMVEALRFRSSIPQLPEILALMIPPAPLGEDEEGYEFYRFWGRAVEPWDGPAFLAFSDGHVVGARLDRNGFRPCRWTQTKDSFFLASEAGIFDIDEAEVLAKGSLRGGTSAFVELDSGEVHFEDPSQSPRNKSAHFDPRLIPVQIIPEEEAEELAHLDNIGLFGWDEEDLRDRLLPMVQNGKEPIGSMGYTARPAVLSELPRSFFDYFYQTFAQVTNPPMDHMRERLVTELKAYLGPRPNIFFTKELLPVAPAIELDSPLLDPDQLAWVLHAATDAPGGRGLDSASIDITFPRVRGAKGLAEALKQIEERALAAVKGGCSIVVLTDRRAKAERPPIPSLLALRAASRALAESGHRLSVSLVVDTADVKNTHEFAALIGFGAAAVCPYMAFAWAREAKHPKLSEMSRGERSAKLRKAFEEGLLKVMSKMGISSVSGYQNSQLFTAYGLSHELVERFFPRIDSPVSGVDLNFLAEQIISRTTPERLPVLDSLPHTHQLKEHRKGEGEAHSMTTVMSKIVHQVVQDTELSLDKWPEWEKYKAEGKRFHPVNLRHLFEVEEAPTPAALEDVQPRVEIMRRFGSGAISFGAISAESQRDIIQAMNEVGGRSGSGEGGENPYYWVDGTAATSKQVASGRFGVTAEYLIAGQEIEIKVAQGAKPGEGGQLMAVKVNEDIAKARHSLPNVDLISPPPLHDIYSIEDLRQLIYELKQLKPGVPVSVKLVSGAGIGTIACGVVKAGADIVMVSGGDGGTGAASVSSMQHAGLPWEIGLAEVHADLLEQGLREHVRLRVDGGLNNGEDLVMAALLGAEEFNFGKLLMIGEGCIMARICEKNTCPRGIATHDPKFKKKYKGTKEMVVALLNYLAEDVRRTLARMGKTRLEEVIGHAELLKLSTEHGGIAKSRGLDLSALTTSRPHRVGYRGSLLSEGTNRLNDRLVEDAELSGGGELRRYRVHSTDRSILSTLSGAYATVRHQEQLKKLGKGPGPKRGLEPSKLRFDGSAGQGFGAFLVEGIEVELYGQANDSVAKSMSGGRMVVRPSEKAHFNPADNTIIGNCALYGATGGKLFVQGVAGDRFAVRNSGATAVIEGVGLHACEYMTRGEVVILGQVFKNVGAGMTGGVVYLPPEAEENVNLDYLVKEELLPEEAEALKALLEEYHAATGSEQAQALLRGWSGQPKLSRFVPIGQARK